MMYADDALSGSQPPAGHRPTQSPQGSPEPAAPAATPPAGSRPALLLACAPDGRVLAAWQMDAPGPGALVRQVAEIASSGQISAEAAGLTRPDPSRWLVLDMARPGARRPDPAGCPGYPLQLDAGPDDDQATWLLLADGQRFGFRTYPALRLAVMDTPGPLGIYERQPAGHWQRTEFIRGAAR